MTIHPALIADAVKAGLEDALKNSAHWETYAAHRGKHLEDRVGELFNQLVPGVTEHRGIEYLVPANESEATGHPTGYTKLVEGDHLFVIHDVALIVEDKAIPLSDRSRTGEVNPLRRNLASAITKGAEQAGRMKERIVDDKGLRLRDGTWLDLAEVREIHSVVTSLDDMPGIATATAGAGWRRPLPPATSLGRSGSTISISSPNLSTVLQSSYCTYGGGPNPGPPRCSWPWTSWTSSCSSSGWGFTSSPTQKWPRGRCRGSASPAPQTCAASRNKFLGLSRATQMIWMRGTAPCTLLRRVDDVTPARMVPHPLPRSSTGSMRTKSSDG